jgi:hypothetical protein
VDWRTVESAACSLGWKDEKRARDMARERRAKPDAEAQVAIEAEQDERHADQARRVLDARDLLIERAIGDIQGMTAKEARRALRDFDGLKDLQFVERIARGRSTEKTAIEGASESYRDARPQPTPELFRRWYEARGWTPHPGQLRVLERPERFVGAVWGVRGGKSTLAARIAEAEAIIPGARVWCVAPTYDLADKVFREVWETYRALGLLLPGSTNSRQQGRIVRPYGGFVERKTADNPDSLVGEALDRVILDEASRCKRSVWDRELRPRLSDRRGRAFLITTPNGQDWVCDSHAQWEKGLAPGWHWTTAATWENTTVFPGGRQDPEIVAAAAYYESLGLSELFDQEYGAEFTVIKGRVFKHFDKRKRMVPHAQALRGVVEYFLGYDWGWNHQCPFILLGRTSGGQWRALDEDCGKGETWDEILGRGEALCERNGLAKRQIEMLVPDPSRPEQAAGFRRAGFRVVQAEYSLAERIMATAKALANGYLMSERCKGLAVEMAMYRHPEDYRGGDVRVVKVDDDRVDAQAGVLATVAKREGRGGLAVAHAH